jgi:hypothetical protein
MLSASHFSNCLPQGRAHNFLALIQDSLFQMHDRARLVAGALIVGDHDNGFAELQVEAIKQTEISSCRGSIEIARGDE